MSGPRRYLVAARRGGAPRAAADAVDALAAARPDARPVRATPGGRRVVEMTDEAARLLARATPGVVVEEDAPLRLFDMPGLPAARAEGGRFARAVRVTAPESGRPVADVTLFGMAGGVLYKATTGADGRAELRADVPRLTRLVASPRQDRWSRLLHGVSLAGAGPLDVTLRPLGAPAPSGWGHRTMGFAHPAVRERGRGVRVAVVDSGVAPRPDLRAAAGHNTLDGGDPAGWRVDEEGHGTHCAGVVAASGRHRGVVGGAPAARLFALKVFPGGRVSDLVEAVEWAVAARADVLSLSLGSRAPSAALADALADADAAGVTAVAAVGNDGGPVAFPASLPTVLGVGAVGAAGTFPGDSAHVLRVGEFADVTGRLFSARFSNVGPGLDLCAPGVAVASTVPTGHAAWDGTSMACPLVAALAALVLEAAPALRTGDAAQPAWVRWALGAGAVDLGMPAAVQGAGLPLAPRVLAAARAAGRGVAGRGAARGRAA